MERFTVKNCSIMAICCLGIAQGDSGAEHSHISYLEIELNWKIVNVNFLAVLSPPLYFDWSATTIVRHTTMVGIYSDKSKGTS